MAFSNCFSWNARNLQRGFNFLDILEQPLETMTGQLGSIIFSFIVSHYLNLSCLSQDFIEFTTGLMFFGFPARNIFIGLLIFSRNIILA